MKIEPPDMNTILTVCSAVILLGVSTALGIMSMPTEMGLAILAGALGMAFSNIDKISEFSGAGFSAKMKNELQRVIDKGTEPDIEPDFEGLPQEIKDLKEKNPNIEKALLALTDAKWTWRSVGGVAKAMSLSRSEALSTLEVLRTAGLAEEGQSRAGKSLWSPTVRGSVIGATIENGGINTDAY